MLGGKGIMDEQMNRQPDSTGPGESGPNEPFGLHETPPGAEVPSENDQILAGLAYASQIIVPALLPVIFLIYEETRNKTFLRYHSVQSLGLLVAAILYYIVAAVVYFLGSATIGCLACVLWLVFLVPAGAMLYYGWLAFRGRQEDVPWLTQFLRDNGWL
jgi:uncharacterized membrane protein